MAAPSRPTLRGDRVIIRPGVEPDLDKLQEILGEESVKRWWGATEQRATIGEKLLNERAKEEEVLLIIEVYGEVAGGIEYYEILEAEFMHAGIDVYVGERWQNKGLGTEAVRLVAQFLLEEKGHHRLIIDPARENERAIAAYKKVGFKPVGTMRQYQRMIDGKWHDGLLMDLLKDELS